MACNLCQQEMTHHGLEASEIHHQLAHELHVIARSGLSNYFLIVWDMVRFSREQGIRCQGCGSAANSLVAYLLNISSFNPLAHDLVFERFLSDERQIVLDIDIDFDAARREEVIQYIYSRWGHEHVAMACTFVTFRARSALREVGKILGLPPEIIDHAAKTVDVYRAGSVQESAGLQDFLHQRINPAKGFCFLTLEDEFGFINVIVRPTVYAKFRQVIRAGGILTVRGKLQREGAVTNVIGNSIAHFSERSR